MEKGSNAPRQVSTLQLSPIYDMRVQGRLDHHWSTWCDGLAISYEGEDIAVLRGWLGDEAALHGVLIKGGDLARPRLLVNRFKTARRAMK